MPFGTLPLHAQMAERAGFGAFELSGGMSAWWAHGVADIGWLTLTEVVDLAGRVARAVDIPVFADADTGFGPAPINVWRSTQEFIKAGIAGIHIEDQEEPKKGGGHGGIRLVADDEAVARLQAAVDAKNNLDPDFVIVARTDGIGADGGSVDEAIRRGNLYLKEAKVDAIFIEGIHSWDDTRRAIAAIDGPTYVIPSLSCTRNEGTPSRAELTEMGQIMQIINFTLPGVQAVWDLLLEVRDSGELAAADDYLRAIYEKSGTENFVGLGNLLVRPDPDFARGLEDKYTPERLKRSYTKSEM